MTVARADSAIYYQQKRGNGGFNLLRWPNLFRKMDEAGAMLLTQRATQQGTRDSIAARALFVIKTKRRKSNHRRIMKFKFWSALLTLSFIYSATFLNLVIAAPLPALTETKLTAPDAFVEQQFGSAVAIQDDIAVVGAPNSSVVSDGSGSAYVFVRGGSGWQFQQKLTASDASSQSFFGVSVAIDGDTIVVGANGDRNAGGFAGAA